MEVKLVQLGSYGNQEFRMTDRECVIGREPSCHIRPDHGRVSKRHCRVYRQGSRLFVEDINSADGTLVNGERIHGPTELHDGDELCAGPVHYLVLMGDEADLAGRDASWVAQAVRQRGGLRGARAASDSNILVSPAVQRARSIIDRMTHDDESLHEHSYGHVYDHEAPPPPRQGLEVEDQQGIALARILDRDLIDEDDIRRVAQQLEELITAGTVRIALDFRNVEHCSSQALSTVLSVYERCRSGGGALKVCTVQPAVAQLFFMTDLHKHIEIFPESGPALKSAWPEPPEAEGRDAPADAGSAGEAAADSPVVRLIVEVGKAKGKAIEVKGRRFAIGRDPRCQLRPNSETVSRVHAIIERRDGKVFVRDFGTKNGTILAGRTLRGEEAEAHDGDALRVGVLGFSLQILPPAGAPAPTDDEALASWLIDQASSADPDAPTALLIPTQPGPAPAAAHDRPAFGGPADPDAPHADPALSTEALACEVVRGVLVARVRASYLDGEETVGPLRYDLQSFFDKPLPRRVVLSLEHVDYLSSRAVGAVLAFFQHLDREHGALRVCCVSPKVLPVLDSMRLPRLVDLYASVEEAIDDPWI